MLLITLLCSNAMAGREGIELLLELPAGRTPGFTVSPGLSVSGQSESLSWNRGPALSFGLRSSGQIGTLPRATVHLEGGARWWWTRYRSDQEQTFSAQVWDLDVDLLIRSDSVRNRDRGSLDGWWLIGGGPTTELWLPPDPWPGGLQVLPNLILGYGLAPRRSGNTAVLELRGVFGISVAEVRGYADSPEGAYTWYHSAGMAGLMLAVGPRFQKTAQPQGR